MANVPQNGKVLVVEGLGRHFDEYDVVRSLDVAVEPGQRVALAGPNGSGKTTVLRCIAGTLSPTRGTIAIAGHPPGSMAARRVLGASLSQERSFYLRLTGRANLLFFARLRHGTGREAARNVEAIIDELEIEEIASRRVDQCSSGMTQQLGLARALLGAPALLVLDEPTRSLDTEATKRFWAALDRRPQTAVVVATHRPDDLARCESRIDLPA